MMQWMRVMRRVLVSSAAAFLLYSPIAAGAATIFVHPSPDGEGTPLQDAIDGAAPYDTLKLVTIGGAGAYFFETVVIDKPLVLEGNCDAAPPASIYGLCNPTTLTIAADDVTVRCLRTLGGTVSSIDVDGRTRVTLDRVQAEGPYAGHGCGMGGSGIRIANSSRVKVSRCAVPDGNGAGWLTTAGIHLVALPPDAKVEVTKSRTVGNAVGILVEDSNDVPGHKFSVRLKNNVIDSNDVGIQLRNTDRARIEKNVVSDPYDALPTAGIALDATSDENLLVKNAVSGSVTDVSDDGSSNCWRRTTFTTGTLPADGCP
jgi:parallel beta-helix repeat protein